MITVVEKYNGSNRPTGHDWVTDDDDYERQSRLGNDVYWGKREISYLFDSINLNSLITGYEVRPGDNSSVDIVGYGEA